MFRAWLVSIPVLVLASCGTSGITCPAVMHGALLTIRLADGWADAGVEGVTLRCPEGVECGLIAPDDRTVLPLPEEVPVPPPGQTPSPTPDPAPATRGTTQELVDGEARYSLDGPREELVVTVSRADGVLTELTVTPDWVRVGGSEECGGPTEAEVVLPAP